MSIATLHLHDRAAPLTEGSALVLHAAAAFYNGLGHYEQALRAAELAAAHPDGWGDTALLVLPELVEAASRCGEAERALGALERLARLAQAGGTDADLGMEARSRALVDAGPAAEGLYREAIRRLGDARMPMALARGHLLFGEWLRREGRRVDARVQLRTAQRMLSELGLEDFAARARRELSATGETARKRTTEGDYALTAQEARIARLAGDGHTNPEIGRELFLSPRTVEWHLRKVFFKLDIGSRRQLRDAPLERVA